MSALRRLRNHADDDLSRPTPQRHASDAVQLAETIIRILDQVAASTFTRALIIPVMRDFERNVLGDVTWQGPTP
jgi:hypothetical protein